MSAAAADLSAIGAGFREPVLASQAVFRDSLAALSRPGKVVNVTSDAPPPAGVHCAANALLLALLDQDTRLWLSPTLASGMAGAHLRFHTGCSLVAELRDADFALVASPSELPPLNACASGSEEYPHRSATLVVQLDALSDDGGWRLTGPGIRGCAQLAALGLGGEFVSQWSRNRKLFPRGVDLFLTCGVSLCGLPRTTRVEL